MTNYHYGDNITQHGSYNIGKIQNNAPVDPQAAFREMIQAVRVLRTQVSPADREAIDAAVATVTSAEPGEGAFRRALREIAGVASVVGQVGAPVIDLPHAGETHPQPGAHQPILPEGNSQEQRLAEGVMLRNLSERLGVALAPRVIWLSDTIRIEVDGASEDLSVLVEVWAHQGRPKPAQKHKVLADTLKLLYVASTLNVSPRLVLCLSDPLAAHHFTTAQSWAAMALRGFGVAVEVVDLPEEVRAAVAAAQKRQSR